jgi:uncharacterized membrane protein YhiD involved in acid resistance
MLRQLATIVAPTLLMFACLVPPTAVIAATQPPADAATQGFPGAANTPVMGSSTEVGMAIVRLPIAAALGAILALRPRRRSQGARSVVVMQTQIMLAVVGAVIMLVVGNSLSRAFGIVGAAGLIRYRASIADPKDAVVMLCALAAGLAVGVELYQFALVATAFMVALLYIVEFFEPPARKRFELKATTDAAEDFRPKLEDVLKAMHLEFDLLEEAEDELRYAVSAPLEVRTRDVSDTLRLIRGGPLVLRWTERKQGR